MEEVKGQALIIGSGVGGSLVSSKRDRINDRLGAPIADVARCEAFLKKKGFVCQFSLEAMGEHKKVVVDKLEALFSTKSKRVIVWYSGHGNPGTGAWIFKPDRTELGHKATAGQCVTPEEVKDLWLRCRGTESHLLLVCDSCFSAHWLKIYDTSSRIHVQCAASTDEEAGEVADQNDANGGYLSLSLIRGIGPSWWRWLWSFWWWITCSFLLWSVLQYFRPPLGLSYVAACVCASVPLFRVAKDMRVFGREYEIAAIFELLTLAGVFFTHFFVLSSPFPATALLCCFAFLFVRYVFCFQNLFWRPSHTPSWSGDEARWADVLQPLNKFWR